MSRQSSRECRDSACELYIHPCSPSCLTVTIALACSRSPPPKEKCMCTQRQLPAAAFRNALRLHRLSTACQKYLQLIEVKLHPVRIRKMYCRGNVQERKGAWASCKLPHTPRLPQRSLTLSLISYRSRELLVHARSISFWTYIFEIDNSTGKDFPIHSCTYSIVI